MPTAPYHTPVLLNEALSLLLTSPSGVYVDSTLGGGGHAGAILKWLDQRGQLIGIDADADAIASATSLLKEVGGRFIGIQGNFGNLKSLLSGAGSGQVRGCLFDLGISSFQLDEPLKGFSFRTDQPLDMRMDRHQALDAATIVNTYDVDRLSDILWTNGEERSARRIAKRIAERRRSSPVATTGDLSRIVQETVGGRFLVKTLARVFQAIRIEVNNELENLRRGLTDAIDVVERGGRIVVISYHSLEDRLVKNIFREASSRATATGRAFLPSHRPEPKLKILTKKPIVPGRDEIGANSRARSAKLRAAERL